MATGFARSFSTKATARSLTCKPAVRSENYRSYSGEVYTSVSAATQSQLCSYIVFIEALHSSITSPILPYFVGDFLGPTLATDGSVTFYTGLLSSSYGLGQFIALILW